MDDRDLLLDRIGELVETAKYRQALRVCDQALGSHPTCAEAHDYRGVILCRMGRYREALPCYDRAISLEPDFVPALLDKAELLVFYLGENEPAIALADRVLRLCSHDADAAHASYLKGVAYANLDQHEEAIHAHEHALELDPEHPDAQCERGVALYESYRFSEALRALKLASELDPAHARPHHYLGCIYEYSGSEELARRELRLAAELDPDSHPLPLELEPADFAAAVREACHTLPREVARLLRELEIVVEPLPDRLSLAEGLLRPSAPVSRGPGGAKVFRFYQRNLEKAARTRAELVEELAHATCHEFGHPELGQR